MFAALSLPRLFLYISVFPLFVYPVAKAWSASTCGALWPTVKGQIVACQAAVTELLVG